MDFHPRFLLSFPNPAIRVVVYCGIVVGLSRAASTTGQATNRIGQFQFRSPLLHVAEGDFHLLSGSIR